MDLATKRCLRGWLWKPPGISVSLCLLLTIAYSVGLGACGGGGSAPTTQPPPATDSLTQADVQMLVQAAATAADADSMAIAVVDRLGRILAVYKGPSAPATLTGEFRRDGPCR